MINIGDVFTLKRDVVRGKIRLRTYKKGDIVILTSYKSNHNFQKTYYFLTYNRYLKRNQAPWDFSLCESLVGKYLESKFERRKRIIKEITNEDN